MATLILFDRTTSSLNKSFLECLILPITWLFIAIIFQTCLFCLEFYFCASLINNRTFDFAFCTQRSWITQNIWDIKFVSILTLFVISSLNSIMCLKFLVLLLKSLTLFAVEIFQQLNYFTLISVAEDRSSWSFSWKLVKFSINLSITIHFLLEFLFQFNQFLSLLCI